MAEQFFAGYSEDETFDEFAEAMAAYRKEINADATQS